MKVLRQTIDYRPYEIALWYIKIKTLPPAAPGKPTLTVSNPNPVEGEVITLTCTPSTSPNERWLYVLEKNGNRVTLQYGKWESGRYTYSHQITYSSADKGSYSCRMYYTCIPHSPDSEGIEVQG